MKSHYSCIHSDLLIVIGEDIPDNMDLNPTVIISDELESCINISTNTDTFIEAEEMLSVSIVSFDPSLDTILVDPASQLAMIQDTTRMYRQNLMVCDVHLSCCMLQKLKLHFKVQYRLLWRTKCS